MLESCYISFEKKERISIICEDCYTKLGLKHGYFWNSKLGYGPFNFICCKCDKIIYKGMNENTVSN